eukprot:7122440-Pyramimonas_sp.AAC.1
MKKTEASSAWLMLERPEKHIHKCSEIRAGFWDPRWTPLAAPLALTLARFARQDLAPIQEIRADLRK